MNAPGALPLDDNEFRAYWCSLSDEQRSAYGPEGFHRYQAITPWLTQSIERQARELEGCEAEMAGNARAWPALDLAALAAHDPKPPSLIIPDWGPAGYAWLLA